MKKTFKRSLSVLLSVLMVLSVLSAGMFTAAADTDFTMIAVVAMKPEEGAEYCTTRFIFNATEEDLTALNGGPVDLGTRLSGELSRPLPRTLTRELTETGA